MRDRHIKVPVPNRGKTIKVSEAQLKGLDLNYPVFCFKHLHKGHDLGGCSKDEQSAFVQRLAKLSGLTWTEIQMADKHGFGSEKISRKSIKPSVPTSITDDVQDFLALRFQNKKPFIGYRNHFIFHIVYIDPKFSVYQH